MVRRNQLKTASFDIRRKAKKCHAFERDHQVYVIPYDQTKEARIVVFLTEGILCISADGQQCPANQRHHVCYHVLSAAFRKRTNRRRRETLAAKKTYPPLRVA